MVEQLVHNIEELERQVENYRKRLEPVYSSKLNGSEKIEDAHVWMLCLSAFPIAVNVQLLYQLWSNFNKISDTDGIIHDLPVSVVSDCILSPFFQQSGKDLYEMDANMRSYLLDKLQKKFGSEIIEELASFLYKYAIHFKSINIWKNFYEAQEWTAILAIDPTKAAINILESLKSNLNGNNAFESMRVANLIGAMIKDNQEFAELIQRSIEKKEDENTPQPKKEEDVMEAKTGKASPDKSIVLRKDGAVSANSIKIDLPQGVGSRLLPVFEAESIQVTNTRYKPEQKGNVYALLVGTNEYQHNDVRSITSVEDAKKIKDALLSKELIRAENLSEYFNTEATIHNVVQQFQQYLQTATADDTILFYFSGNTRLIDGVCRLFFYDYQETKIGLPSGTLSQVELKVIVQRYAERQAKIVFILDTSYVGSTEWLDKENPRHYALLACQEQEDQAYDNPSLTNFLVEAINSKPFVSYKYLYSYVLKHMELQTPYFVVHPQSWNYYFLTDIKENETMQLQEMLVALGYNVSVDGRNGPNTQRAISDFMEKYQVNQEEAVRIELKKAVMLKTDFAVKALCVFRTDGWNSTKMQITNHLKGLRAEVNFQKATKPKETGTR